MNAFDPSNLEFVVLSFEGPDQPYSHAGGLAVRVTHLTATLARRGFTTHLFFVGDPNYPGFEQRENGKLHLNRWCQWQSRYHPAGVYDNEIAKVGDLQESIPWHLTEFVIRPALAAGKYVAVIAEEWHTADALARLSDSLHFSGLRRKCILMWNANNDMSFHRINWERVRFVAQFTAVSRYLKHQMRQIGGDALVIPNGIPRSLLEPIDEAAVKALRQAAGADYFFLKIGRMDPDKGWVEAADAVAELRRRGANAKLIMKGGQHETHRGHFLGHLTWLGLRFKEVQPSSTSMEALTAAIGQAAPEADVIDVQPFIPEQHLAVFYAAADATLANSLYEPFGLVGLEAMAAGGIAFVGSTGEDYAVSAQNAVVLDTGFGPEIALMAEALARDPAWAKSIRGRAREFAALFTWDNSVDILLRKLPLMARNQEVE